MLINEVCKKCSLTKKAVEYYRQQGLIVPAVQENGYRDFSERDVMALRKISVLRGLGLSVGEIRSILSETGAGKETLAGVSFRKAMEATVLQEKQKLRSEERRVGKECS